jgi:hypothetical protein
MSDEKLKIHVDDEGRFRRQSGYGALSADRTVFKPVHRDASRGRITYCEPHVAEARAAMRRVYESYPAAVEKAGRGRHRMLTKYSPPAIGTGVTLACASLLEDLAFGPGRGMTAHRRRNR